MPTLLSKLRAHLAAVLAPRGALAVQAPRHNGKSLSPWSSDTFVNVLPQHQREPTSHELLAELKNTAFACVSINAAVCAAHPPRLYVATYESQPRPRVATRGLGLVEVKRLRSQSHLSHRLAKAVCIEEVVDHPLLTLLRQVNAVHNAFDLWELTTMYQEVHGCAYWLLRFGPLGVPEEIWVLPSQHVRIVDFGLRIADSLHPQSAIHNPKSHMNITPAGRCVATRPARSFTFAILIRVSLTRPG